MNRKERRLHAKNMRERYPKKLTEIMPENWPSDRDESRFKVFVSDQYMVQLFEGPDSIVRMSVNRTTVLANGRWGEDLTWDELQAIKRDVGYGSRDAVEVYPNDKDVVNVANMRHLWILPYDLYFKWQNGCA